MGFRDRLARLTQDPEMRRLAVRRAGSHELAEDALQETARAIVERKGSEPIENLAGFFYVALIREIDHQLGRPTAIPVGDITLVSDRRQGSPDTTRSASTRPPAPVDSDAHLRMLAQSVLDRLDRAHARDGLVLIPGRSGDPGLYRSAIARTAKIIFALLLEGCLTSADWNAVLKSAYPQWCDEPGLDRAARDQRLSRARQDVKTLLRVVLSRDQLAS